MSLENDVLQEYGKRFTQQMRETLMAHGIDPLHANTYHPHFTALDVLFLALMGCGSEIANLYPSELGGRLTGMLYKLGISSEAASEPGLSAFKNIFKGDFDNDRSVSYYLHLAESLKVCGIGKQGIVLFNNEDHSPMLVKFSDNMKDEFYALEAIRDAAGHSSPLLSHLPHYYPLGEYVEMEFIKGLVARDAILGKGISSDDAANYSRQLLFEIINELDKVGYHHRDLHPDNIIIEEDTQLLKVLDFGKSSQEKSCAYTHNRYSGGRDDLYSWALMSYSFFTGEHLCGSIKKGEPYEHFKDKMAQKLDDLYTRQGKIRKPFRDRINQHIPEQYQQAIILALEQDSIAKVMDAIDGK